jgi:hypothetical protein
MGVKAGTAATSLAGLRRQARLITSAPPGRTSLSDMPSLPTVLSQLVASAGSERTVSSICGATGGPDGSGTSAVRGFPASGGGWLSQAARSSRAGMVMRMPDRSCKRRRVPSWKGG